MEGRVRAAMQHSREAHAGPRRATDELRVLEGPVHPSALVSSSTEIRGQPLRTSS